MTYRTKSHRGGRRRRTRKGGFFQSALKSLPKNLPLKNLSKSLPLKNLSRMGSFVGLPKTPAASPKPPAASPKPPAASPKKLEAQLLKATLAADKAEMEKRAAANRPPTCGENLRLTFDQVAWCKGKASSEKPPSPTELLAAAAASPKPSAASPKTLPAVKLPVRTSSGTCSELSDQADKWNKLKQSSCPVEWDDDFKPIPLPQASNCKELIKGTEAANLAWFNKCSPGRPTGGRRRTRRGGNWRPAWYRQRQEQKKQAAEAQAARDKSYEDYKKLAADQTALATNLHFMGGRRKSRRRGTKKGMRRKTARRAYKGLRKHKH